MKYILVVAFLLLLDSAFGEDQKDKSNKKTVKRGLSLSHLGSYNSLGYASGYGYGHGHGYHTPIVKTYSSGHYDDHEYYPISKLYGSSGLGSYGHGHEHSYDYYPIVKSYIGTEDIGHYGYESEYYPHGKYYTLDHGYGGHGGYYGGYNGYYGGHNGFYGGHVGLYGGHSGYLGGVGHSGYGYTINHGGNYGKYDHYGYH